MTLCLAILTEEGVVMTADSLGTLMTMQKTNLKIKCPTCEKEILPDMICPDCKKLIGKPNIAFQFPTNQTFHCQKLFKLNRWVGLSMAGEIKFKGLKIQHWISNFTSWLINKKQEKDKTEKIIDSFKEFLNEKKILENFPGRAEFIIAGMSENEMEPCLCQKIELTKNGIKIIGEVKFGISAIGVADILDKMFGGGGINKYPVKDFPLQDAVEFATFLMQTQIGVEKYSNKIPVVGGDIDVAVIHPVKGFTWVNQKELQKILDA